MRRMTIPAIALAISLAPAALAAQTPAAQPGPRGPAFERIIEQRAALGLTDQQVAQLRQIQTRLEEQNRPLLQQLQTARRELTPQQRQQMRAHRDSMRARAPEQRQQMREQMRERMQQMTPEQRQQMRERMQQMTPEQRQQMREQMRREGTPRPAAGPRPGMPAELQPVLEQIRANTREAATQVHATLTPEQRQKLIELRPARRGPRGS